MWYRKPAANWDEALPIGNGRLGAMIFGRFNNETIQVNEESVWYGSPMDRVNPDAKENLRVIRKLIEDGDVVKAQSLMDKALSGCPQSMRQYQTLGDIHINHELVWGDEVPSDYRRELSLDEAVYTSTYTIDETFYENEMFASYPDDCLVYRITAAGKNRLRFTIRLGRGRYFDGTKKVGANGIALFGNLGKGAADFAMMLKARALGDGKVYTIGECLCVEDAKEVVLIFSADTSYQHGDVNYSVSELLDSLNDKIDIALDKSYEALKKSHIDDYRSLYGRLSLKLENESEDLSALPTDVRLSKVHEGGEDLALLTELCDFGRYLTIACSRKGTMASTLQGLWNDSFTPPWDSKYTININTEMNYWPVEISNLSECHEPLFELLESMRRHGRIVARDMYGLGGFTAHHNTDIHGDCAPQDIWIPGTFWNLAPAWISTHVYRHYEYSLDLNCLKKHFPAMLEAAIFYLDYLCKYRASDGVEYLVVNPSVSPENSYYLPDGSEVAVCLGATMDAQVLRHFFDCIIKAYDLLKDAELDLDGIEELNSGADVTSLVNRVKDAIKHLTPTRMGKNGTIMEWMEDYDEVDPGHRHISHLYGLFPGNEISVEKTPELAQAAAATLKRRLANGGGHTGWSVAWIINHYASLRDGDNAYQSILKMMRNSLYPNLFDKHPPFQIDGNFGVTAGILRMLVTSDDEKVILLPALPKEWSKGSVRGVCVPGNVSLDFSWENGSVTECKVHAKGSFNKKIYYNGEMHEYN